MQRKPEFFSSKESLKSSYMKNIFHAVVLADKLDERAFLEILFSPRAIQKISINLTNKITWRVVFHNNY